MLYITVFVSCYATWRGN